MRLQDIVPWHARRPAQTTEMTDPFQRMHDEMDRMLSDAFAEPTWPPVFGMRASSKDMAPHMDISETDDAIEVTLDLPGVDPKDVDVSLNNGILSITAARETEDREEDKNFHRVERFRGRFVRRLALPHGVEDDRIEAHQDKGVLRIRVPKSPEAKATQKRIEIKSA